LARKRYIDNKKRRSLEMGKPKYLPTGKVLEDSVTRAAEVAKFLLEA